MMAVLPYSLLPLIFLLIAHTTPTSHSHPSHCDTMSCESPKVPIPFPFWLNQPNQTNNRCGYPGFELKCSNKNQTILNLPESGDFIVKRIFNEDNKIWVNVDPDECLPRRIMLGGGLSLAGSPFHLGSSYTLANYSFFNCPYDPTSDFVEYSIDCLRPKGITMNYSVVVAVLSNPKPSMKSCHFISSAMVPVPGFLHHLYWSNYLFDVQLQWDNLPYKSKGLSRNAIYGLSIGIGVPALIVLIWLVCVFHRWISMNNDQQQHQNSIEFSTTGPSLTVMGLDGPTIERYPKTQIGDSGRLPKPNDSTCSICLCEYQPNEVLRTIPDCNHYFHSDCIDEWLRMNATCPLCRNQPLRSSSSCSSFPLSPTSST